MRFRREHEPTSDIDTAAVDVLKALARLGDRSKVMPSALARGPAHQFNRAAKGPPWKSKNRRLPARRQLRGSHLDGL
jgi:hypothetical protein